MLDSNEGLEAGRKLRLPEDFTAKPFVVRRTQKRFLELTDENVQNRTSPPALYQGEGDGARGSISFI